MSSTRKLLGNRGEEIAAEYLQERGYTLVDRRWRCRYGEIDLIARKGDTLVFVEVRSRRGSVDDAAQSVGPLKQNRLQLLATEYLAGMEAPQNARIDVVCVAWKTGAPPEVEHIEGAVEVDPQ